MQDIFLGNPPALIFAKENLGRRINFAYFSCSVSSRIPLSLSLVNVFIHCFSSLSSFASTVCAG